MEMEILYSGTESRKAELVKIERLDREVNYRDGRMFC